MNNEICWIVELLICWSVDVEVLKKKRSGSTSPLRPLNNTVDHSELVQTGVYRFVRHPLYSSQLFAAFGWAIFTLSLSHFLLLVAAFLFFSYKADKEEQWLKERHPEYAEYAKRVKKFIPWVYW